MNERQQQKILYFETKIKIYKKYKTIIMLLYDLRYSQKLNWIVNIYFFSQLNFIWNYNLLLVDYIPLSWIVVFFFYQNKKRD